MANREYSASAPHLKRFVARPEAWSGDAIVSRLSRVASCELWTPALLDAEERTNGHRRLLNHSKLSGTPRGPKHCRRLEWWAIRK